MYYNYNKGLDSVNVEFFKVEKGYMYFNININDTLFESRFSDCGHIILDLKHWLESIAIGAQQTSIDYWSDKSCIVFNFINHPYTNDEFTISIKDVDELMSIKPNRVAFIRAFYEAFLLFIHSTKYKREEWEYEDLKMKFCRIKNVNESELVKILCDYSADEIHQALFEMRPSKSYYTPTEEEIKVGYVESLKLKFTPADFNQYGEIVHFINNWLWHKNYAGWDVERKLSYLEDCFEEQTSEYYGGKVTEFQSELIEKYLQAHALHTTK
ncbi:MAG: hypothetical protein RIQ33_94 [Bacteroidota bacterium]